ncbi:MAG: HU family DNA-binding protein [Planctomycetales bacterium]|nr:HU family DNA-binding protein [Planctomycetales bacterium]
MDKPLTKTQTLNTLAERTGLSKQQVTSVLEELGNLIVESVATDGPGVFTVPNLMKVKVQRKPAEPERPGINPFTKEPTIIKAKPARNVVKISPLKALKDRV